MRKELDIRILVQVEWEEVKLGRDPFQTLKEIFRGTLPECERRLKELEKESNVEYQILDSDISGTWIEDEELHKHWENIEKNCEIPGH
jgi:hypothetical protein